MGETRRIGYRFDFENGELFEYAVSLDEATFSIIPRLAGEPPQWALLRRNRCPNCTLDEERHPHCPVAANLSDIISHFKDHLSYRSVRVTVTTEQRSYAADTSLQMGLSSLIGLVMATSGCPVLDKLRPMARFHLPFASVEETEYRMVSMYLVAQYYLRLEGIETDLQLNGLRKICAEVGTVNNAFAQRIREAARNDASINSLVYLDCFAKSTPYAVTERMKDYRCCFESYFVG